MSHSDTLSKQRLVRLISQQTGLTNRDVQHVIEAQVTAISAHLSDGGRIEIENFLVVEVYQATQRAMGADSSHVTYRVKAKISRTLRQRIAANLKASPNHRATIKTASCNHH